MNSPKANLAVRIVIKNILVQWIEHFPANPSETHFDWPPDAKRNPSEEWYWLDFSHVLFLRDVARLANDKKLMRLTEIIRLELSKRNDTSTASALKSEQGEEAQIAFESEVKKICIRFFYKEPKLKVDMSKYREAIKKARPLIADTSLIMGLEKYLDEKKLFNKIYVVVRNALQHRFVSEGMTSLPTLKDVEAEFHLAMADAYRRADITVYERLAKASACGPMGAT